MTPQGFICRLQYSSWSSLGETPCKLWKHEGCGHSTSISAARRSARGQQPDIWLLLWDCLARFFDLYNSNELVKRFISAFDLSVRWCSYFEFKLAVRSSYYVEPGDKKHNEIREVELVHLDRQRSGSRQNADDCGSKPQWCYHPSLGLDLPGSQTNKIRSLFLRLPVSRQSIRVNTNKKRTRILLVWLVRETSNLQHPKYWMLIERLSIFPFIQSELVSSMLSAKPSRSCHWQLWCINYYKERSVISLARPPQRRWP